MDQQPPQQSRRQRSRGNRDNVSSNSGGGVSSGGGGARSLGRNSAAGSNSGATSGTIPSNGPAGGSAGSGSAPLFKLLARPGISPGTLGGAGPSSTSSLTNETLHSMAPMSTSSQIHPQQQLQPSQPHQQQHQKEPKQPRQRTRRDRAGGREKSSRLQYQQGHGNEDDTTAGGDDDHNSNDGSKQFGGGSESGSGPNSSSGNRVVVVDPNSFQRQIYNSSNGTLKPPTNLDDDFDSHRHGYSSNSHSNNNSSSGVAGLISRSETNLGLAQNSGQTVSAPGGRRKDVSGRGVYSWQGSSKASSSAGVNQQQQQQQHHQSSSQRSLGPREIRSVATSSQNGLHSSSNVNLSAGRAGVAPGRPAPMVIIPPPPAMENHAVKFMEQDGTIVDGVSKWFSEHPGHFVVGILGFQGVGKSSILSSLCGSGPVSNRKLATAQSKAPISSSATSATPASKPSMSSVPNPSTPSASVPMTLNNPSHKFKVYPQTQSVGGPAGMDMYVTAPERMVLLDTEPLYSLASLEHALRYDRIPEGIPVDLWLDHQALTLASFLLSICNVVMFVIDPETTDMVLVMRLLQRVELCLRTLAVQNVNGVTSITSLSPGTMPIVLESIGSATSAVGASGSAASTSTMGMSDLMTVAGTSATIGEPQTSLADWCADILFVDNKVPTTDFLSLAKYKSRSRSLARLFSPGVTKLKLFGSIHMPKLYPRFEKAFSGSATTLLTAVDQSAQDSLNLIRLPFDSRLVMSSHSASLAETSATAALTATTQATAPFNSTSRNPQKTKSVRSYETSKSVTGNLTLHWHTALADAIEDQERFSVWSRPLRNQLLTMSMRLAPPPPALHQQHHQQQGNATATATGVLTGTAVGGGMPAATATIAGGPWLGSRNRPGVVSEKEWLKFATKAWETIRKSEFGTEFVHAARIIHD